MKHVLRVINVLATVVILVAFVVLLRTVFTPAGEIPTIMGYGFMRTLTGSMEPAIPVHSFIVVDTDNSQVYQVGDIITFHSSDDALEGSLNTHRIVSVEAASDDSPVYHTKGGLASQHNPTLPRFPTRNLKLGVRAELGPHVLIARGAKPQLTVIDHGKRKRPHAGLMPVGHIGRG